MEFPDDFTTFPGTPTGSDYVLLDKYRATLDQLAAYIAPSIQTLVEWNGTDVTQFTSGGNIGTPTNPSIAFAAQTTGGTDAIRLKLGAGTNANEGRIYWFAETASFQSMRIQFQVYVDAANPIQPGEALAVGVIVAGSAGTGNNLSFTVSMDDIGAGNLTGACSSAYNTFDGFALATTALDGGYVFDVDITLTARLTDTGTYTPNGAPAMVGVANVAGSSGTTGLNLAFTCASTVWNAAVGALDTNRIGVGVSTSTGVTATTGLLLANVKVTTA